MEGRALCLCSPGAFYAGQWKFLFPGKNQAWLLVAQGAHKLAYISWAVFQFSLRPFHKGVNSHPKASPHTGTDCVVTASFSTASLSSHSGKNLCSACQSSGGTCITPSSYVNFRGPKILVEVVVTFLICLSGNGNCQLIFMT